MSGEIDSIFVSGRRVAVNTAITYARSIIGMLFGLFSSRWILMSLGETDFGLYGLVGCLIVAVSFVNLVLSNATSRFYAVAVGERDGDVAGWFNAAVSVHATLALVVLFVGFPLGEYAIGNWLAIPEDRVSACRFVFSTSLVATAAGVLIVPYSAMFTARQKFGELATYALLASAFTCVVAGFMRRASGDRLMLFAALVSGFSCLMSVVQAVRARIRFSECSIRFSKLGDMPKVKELLSYSGWRILGTSGWLAQRQGAAFVVNLAFGAAANAAYSIASQFAVHASSLTTALSSAVTPAIATTLGKGDETRTSDMALASCRFMGFLAALIGIPLAVEARAVLSLWLVTPPGGAWSLAVFFTVAMIVDSSSAGIAAGLGAHRNIAVWQTFAFVVLAVTCPVAWVGFKTGCGLSALGCVFVFAACVMTAGRVYFAKKLLGVSSGEWQRKVALPLVGVWCFSALASLSVHFCLTEGLVRVLSVGLVSLATTLIASYLILFTERERTAIWQMLLQKRR